jgi:hypothetical protein
MDRPIRERIEERGMKIEERGMKSSVLPPPSSILRQVILPLMVHGCTQWRVFGPYR